MVGSVVDVVVDSVDAAVTETDYELNSLYYCVKMDSAHKEDDLIAEFRVVVFFLLIQ